MKPIHAIQLVLLGTIWGSSYLFVKVAVEGIDPLTLVAGRVAIGALFLLAVVRLRGSILPSEARTWVHVLVMALSGNVVPFTLIAWGQQSISSGLASILNATTPFFTVLFAVIAFRIERFTAPKVLGLLIGFSGVAVLTGADLADLRTVSAQGQLALLLSSVCYGLAFAYARRFLRGEPIVLAAAQMIAALALIAPVALVLGDPLAADLTPARVAAWLALGGLSSGVAYIIYYSLIGSVGATAASFGTYLMPIVGVSWGWLLLGESFGARSLVGVSLILAGLVVATARIRRPRAASEGTPAVARD